MSLLYTPEAYLPEHPEHWSHIYVMVLHEYSTRRQVCKVGISVDPNRRLREVGEKYWKRRPGQRIFIAAYFACPFAQTVEQQIHRYFKDRRVEGEWFAVEPAEAIDVVLDHIEKLCEQRAEQCA